MNVLELVTNRINELKETILNPVLPEVTLCADRDDKAITIDEYEYVVSTSEVLAINIDIYETLMGRNRVSLDDSMIDDREF